MAKLLALVISGFWKTCECQLHRTFWFDLKSNVLLTYLRLLLIDFDKKTKIKKASHVNWPIFVNYCDVLIFEIISCCLGPERLAESLRLPQVLPGLQSQVFLCFRVLLLRMSPHHVTSLWPIIVSEMVQVMLHMEHDLSTDTDEFRYANYFYLFDGILFLIFAVHITSINYFPR